MNSDSNFDVVIIGAGAAGLMCAYNAAIEGKKVCVLEHNDRPGRKILISGGGRCNFTNLYSSPNDYYSSNPHFCKSALKRFTPHDFINMIEDNNISYYEKKLGQLFCQTSAKDILNFLLHKCHEHNVHIMYKATSLTIEKEKNHFLISNNISIQLSAPNLVVATGGMSIPKIGATDFGLNLAKQFGHNICQTRAGLVPLKFPGMEQLAGVSQVATVSCKVGSKRHEITEDVLITHRGFSGPAILKISLYWIPKQKIKINWLPEVDLEKELIHKRQINEKTTLKQLLKGHLTKRFFEHFININNINPDKKIGELSNNIRLKFAQSINQFEFTPTESEGFNKAEVMIGGVDTKNISSKTMESKIHPGLYFIGEVLDVTGQLGGHNFQWAWASAHAAGKAIGQSH